MRIRIIRNIWEPTELVRFLITVNVVLFVTALLFAVGAVNFNLNPMVFLSPATGVLFKLGASGTLPVFAEDRWWTLITANYLHGSLLHLLFNVSALHAVGKINIEIYAPSRLFLIYFSGGIFSMAVSSRPVCNLPHRAFSKVPSSRPALSAIRPRSRNSIIVHLNTKVMRGFGEMLRDPCPQLAGQKRIQDRATVPFARRLFDVP